MPDDHVDDSEYEQRARNIVLRQLSSAPKSRYQLEQKLQARDIPDDVLDRVLHRFEEVGLIDDAEYAQMWVRSRHRSKGLARRALSMELRQRGIADTEAETALEQVSDSDEWSKAHELVVKKLTRSTSQIHDRKQRDRMVRRLVGMLSRKGYAPGLAFSVVTDALNADDLDSLAE